MKKHFATRSLHVRASRHHRDARRAYSLLEMIAVITLLGMFALMAVAHLRPETFGDMSAKVDARRLALDLMQTRRRAIATGDNHFLLVKRRGAKMTYTIHRRLAGGRTRAVDSTREFPPNVTVSFGGSAPEFNFEGAALSAYTITLTAPDRRWQVDVAQATGSVRVIER